MPQPTKGPRLGGSPAHQRLILANLATSLFQHGRISTTEAKARKLRPYAERLISKAKVGDLHNRREIQKLIRDKSVVHRLIAEIGPFFADRHGGYTRITKTMPRKGDNAPMAVIELVAQKTVTDEAERARRVASSQKAASAAAPVQAAAAPVADPEVAATEVAATEVAATEVAATEVAATEVAATEVADAELAATEVADAELAATEVADAELAATEVADAELAATEVADAEAGPYGEGSHAPLDDPSAAPDGFEIKGNADSMLYHVPGSSHYDRTVAEVWFATAEAAEAAGFELPKSQREDDSTEES